MNSERLAGLRQPTLSRLKSQEDMQINTLRRVVKAPGGDLEIIAHPPNGDLFWVHRVEHFPAKPTSIPALAARMGEPFPNGYSDRMQSIVRRDGNGWRPGPARPAPFPHSGFPAVVMTKEGVILHLATDSVYWTADVGKTWTRLPIPGTHYYPQALQLPDGKIVCISHVGSDDVYGTVDQSITQQVFRLKVEGVR